MQKLSLGAAAEQTKIFMRREGSLVIPVAFATFGLALILVGLITPQPAAGQQVKPGLWTLAVAPMVFLSVLGQLAISYLALRPGASVRDALSAAVKRLPLALAVILLLFAAFGVTLVLLVIVMALVAVAASLPPEGVTVLTAFVLALLGLLIGARLLLVWPLMADRRSGAVTTLKEGLVLSKGNVWKLILLLIAFALVYGALTGAVQLGLGSLLLIFGKLAGFEAEALFLTSIVVALLAAIIQGVWAVFLTFVYRQVAPPPAAWGVPSTR